MWQIAQLLQEEMVTINSCSRNQIV